jgi:hypothetical protein
MSAPFSKIFGGSELARKFRVPAVAVDNYATGGIYVEDSEAKLYGGVQG